MATKRKRKPVPARSESELKQFVLDYLAGRIFTSEHIAPTQLKSLLHLIFLPLALGGLKDTTPKSLGVIWEYFNRRGYRSINGYPTFMSCYLMNTRDWKRCLAAIAREQKKLQDLKV